MGGFTQSFLELFEIPAGLSLSCDRGDNSSVEAPSSLILAPAAPAEIAGGRSSIHSPAWRWSSIHSSFQQEIANQSWHRGADTTLGGASAPALLVEVCLHQIFIPVLYSSFLFLFSHCSLSQGCRHPSSNPSPKHTPSPPVPLTRLHSCAAHFKPLQIKFTASPMLQLFPLSFLCRPQTHSPAHTSRALLSLICTLLCLAFICL